MGVRELIAALFGLFVPTLRASSLVCSFPWFHWWTVIFDLASSDHILFIFAKKPVSFAKTESFYAKIRCNGTVLRYFIVFLRLTEKHPIALTNPCKI